MRSHHCWAGAAAGHLLLVLFGASQKPLPLGGSAGSLVQTYGALSGATTGYSFFAPGVQSQLRAEFTIERADGSRAEDVLWKEESREAELRLNSVVGTMWEKISDERVRRSVAASLAAKVVSRHPGARAVEVRLKAYALPPMGPYRDGYRPEWEPFYSAKFSLSPSAGAPAKSPKGTRA